MVATLLLLMNSAIVPRSVHAATYTPGVSAGQYMDFTQFTNYSNDTLPPSYVGASFDNLSSVDNLVHSVNGNNVTSFVTFHFTNGTAPRTTVYSGNVQTGAGNLTILILSGGLSAGDPPFLSTQTGFPIQRLNETVYRSYAGALRSTNVFDSLISYGALFIRFSYSFDAATGFLVEISESGLVPSSTPGHYVKFAFDGKATTTNAWGSLPTPDFGIDATPAASTRLGGAGSFGYNLNFTSLFSLSGTVNVVASLVGTNATVASPPTVSLKTNSVVLSSGGFATDILTITAGTTTTQGLYIVSVTGTQGSMSHTDLLTFTVGSPAPFDYSLTNNGAITIQAGNTGTEQVTATLVSGTAESITLSCISPPTGITCTSFNPASITPSSTGTSSTLTLDVASSVTAGFDLIQVYGTPSGASTALTYIPLTVTSSSSVGGNLIGTVTVGKTPYGVVYDSKNGYMYVANSGSSSISVISGTTLVTTISNVNAPHDLAFDSANGNVYATNPASNTMTVINGTTNVITGTVSVGSTPIGIAYDSRNGYIYVADHVPSGVVTVINGATDTVVTSVAVGSYPIGATFDSGNGGVYVTNFSSGTVSIINGTTVTSTVTVGSIPYGAAYDSGNGYVYVANNAANSVSVISGSTIVTTIPVGNNPYYPGYDSGTGTVYVANNASNSTSVISGTTVVATVPVGNYPYGVGYDTTSGDIYVTNAGTNTVSVLSTTTTAPFDYSLANDIPASVTAGTSGRARITATTIAGTGAPVTLSCVTPSLPTGITCGSFGVNPVTPSPSSVGSWLTINVASSVAAGSYTFQVTGSPLGASTTPTTVTVVVAAAAAKDTTMTVVGNANCNIASGAATCTTGLTVTVTDTTTLSHIPQGTVTFSLTAGSTGAYLAVSSCSLGTAGTCAVPVTATSAGVATFTATYGGDSTHNGSTSATASFTVTASAAFDYRLSVTPASGTINAGQSISATVKATLTAGTAQSVILIVSAISPNPTACQTVNYCGNSVFSPTSVTPTSGGATSTFTLSTTANVPPGTYTITISGTPAGASAASATFTVTINSPNNGKSSSSISIACSPTSVNTGVSTTCTATVTGSSPSGSVSFTSSSSTGTFTPASCTLASGTCSVSYSDSATASITATITASYNGDTHNNGNTGTSSLTVTAPSPAPSQPTILGISSTLFYIIIGVVVVAVVGGIAVVILRGRKPPGAP